MANIVLNIALGYLKRYAEQVGVGNAALILVPIETSGLETDSVLRDKDDLAAFLSGTTNEQTTMGRKTVTACTATVDDTNDRLALDFADQTWTAASGNAISKLLICFDPDTTTGTDSSIVPLSLHDVTLTPDGNNFTLTVADFARVTSAA
jgi:ABC-type transport system substrate-binding protein